MLVPKSGHRIVLLHGTKKDRLMEEKYGYDA